MSNEAIKWAFKQQLPTTPKFVLVTLAYCADDAGECSLPHKALADLVGASKRTVMMAVKQLTEQGCLTSVRQQSDNRASMANRYCLHLDRVGGGDAPEQPAPRPKRRSVSTSKALAVFARDAYMCQHCGTRDQLTVDHIKPVARGGGNELENLRTLCRPCNSSKGDRAEPSPSRGMERIGEAE